jgi:transposase
LIILWIYRYSLLPALSLLDGILHVNIVEGSFTGETFKQFIKELLDVMNPFPMKNSVLVMDNCAIHKVPGIKEMVEERYVSHTFTDPLSTPWLMAYLTRGVILVYLPPYSPDFNPIELAFSSIKAYIHARDGMYRTLMSGEEEAKEPLLLALLEAVYSVTPEKARGWFKKCSYIN